MTECSKCHKKDSKIELLIEACEIVISDIPTHVYAADYKEMDNIFDMCKRAIESARAEIIE